MNIALSARSVLALTSLVGVGMLACGHSTRHTDEPRSPSQLRQHLIAIVHMLSDIANVGCQADTKRLCALAQRELPGLDNAHFDFLESNGVDATMLRAAVTQLRRTVFSTGDSGGPPRTPVDFPSAPYSGLCGSERNPTGVIFAAQVALQAGKVVRSAASRACEQTVVVLGEGGNTSAACIVVDATLLALEAVFDDFKFCDEDIDSAEINGSYVRLEHLHTDVEALDRKLVAIDDKLDGITDAIEVLRVQNNEAIRLMCTAEDWRRSNLSSGSGHPGWPYVWPENPPR